MIQSVLMICLGEVTSGSWLKMWCPGCCKLIGSPAMKSTRLWPGDPAISPHSHSGQLLPCTAEAHAAWHHDEVNIEAPAGVRRQNPRLCLTLTVHTPSPTLLHSASVPSCNIQRRHTAHWAPPCKPMSLLGAPSFPVVTSAVDPEWVATL